ncbi:CSEP0334 putative effector protein [Blumeria hordei DH14]|uniref:CSEP0334 putative effector protein n=1 Tax=Blumeria graminis f. sp. hordei (strain DH14) TaxID=546991 RepID=N1J6U3_BLUG1|nr:CSEP0334 putative effector protein [Blumeria hordei DH14]
MFDGIGVLFSIFWYLHSGPRIHAFPNDSNPKEKKILRQLATSLQMQAPVVDIPQGWKIPVYLEVFQILLSQGFLVTKIINMLRPIPCLELSYPAGNSETGTDSNYFEGYNCTGAVFSDEYIKRSMTIASGKKKRKPENYPREFILKNGRSVLSWPILASHNIYKPGCGSNDDR